MERLRQYLDASGDGNYANQRIGVLEAMGGKDQTFGKAISQARKALGMSQKELAALIMREDNDPISPQYLNDIEHDRRSPSSDWMVQQFAETLRIDVDFLYYLAGKFPADVRERNLTSEQVAEAMVAFRGKPKRK